jgi:hypothetical protein
VTERPCRSCFAWFEERAAAGLDRAAMAKRARWVPGQIVRVGFLGGSADVRQEVLDVAREWVLPGLANLELERVNDAGAADVRVSFTPGAGSWSAIGTTCRAIAKDKATMNLGWREDAAPGERRAVVLHEFGHVLGLLHEHASPAANLVWDKEAVYRDLAGPPNHWSKEVIDQNLFTPWERAETNFTAFDPSSIMVYPIPAHWTVGGVAIAGTLAPSPKDRELVAREYPW